MALLVGVSRNSKIMVGDSVLTVVDIRGTTMSLRVDSGPEFMVNHQERTEILPEVFVFVGKSHIEGSIDRLAFEAPRSISILREALVGATSPAEADHG